MGDGEIMAKLMQQQQCPSAVRDAFNQNSTEVHRPYGHVMVDALLHADSIISGNL